MVASTSQRGSVSRVLLIAAALAAAGLLLWFAREDVAREPVARDPVQVAAQAEVERRRLLELVANQLPEAPEGPCLPLAWRDADATPEPEPAARWTAIDAAGERLREFFRRRRAQRSAR